MGDWLSQFPILSTTTQTPPQTQSRRDLWISKTMWVVLSLLKKVTFNESFHSHKRENNLVLLTVFIRINHRQSRILCLILSAAEDPRTAAAAAVASSSTFQLCCFDGLFDFLQRVVDLLAKRVDLELVGLYLFVRFIHFML